MTAHNTDFRLTCIAAAQIPAKNSPKEANDTSSEVKVKAENDLDNDRLSDEGVDDEEDEENEKETTKKAAKKLNKKTKGKAVKRLGGQQKQKSKYWLLRRTC